MQTDSTHCIMKGNSAVSTFTVHAQMHHRANVKYQPALTASWVKQAQGERMRHVASDLKKSSTNQQQEAVNNNKHIVYLAFQTYRRMCTCKRHGTSTYSHYKTTEPWCPITYSEVWEVPSLLLPMLNHLEEERGRCKGPLRQCGTVWGCCLSRCRMQLSPLSCHCPPELIVHIDNEYYCRLQGHLQTWLKHQWLPYSAWVLTMLLLLVIGAWEYMSVKMYVMTQW